MSRTYRKSKDCLSPGGTLAGHLFLWPLVRCDYRRLPLCSPALFVDHGSSRYDSRSRRLVGSVARLQDGCNLGFRVGFLARVSSAALASAFAGSLPPIILHLQLLLRCVVYRIPGTDNYAAQVQSHPYPDCVGVHLQQSYLYVYRWEVSSFAKPLISILS